MAVSWANHILNLPESLNGAQVTPVSKLHLFHVEMHPEYIQPGFDSVTRSN